MATPNGLKRRTSMFCFSRFQRLSAGQQHYYSDSADQHYYSDSADQHYYSDRADQHYYKARKDVKCIPPYSPLFLGVEDKRSFAQFHSWVTGQLLLNGFGKTHEYFLLIRSIDLDPCSQLKAILASRNYPPSPFALLSRGMRTYILISSFPRQVA